MKCISLAILAGGLALAQAHPATASEEQFLTSLEGQYEGKGHVRLRTNRGPINVTCSFQSTATADTLSLDGTCRGLVVVSRSVDADLTRRGASYTGTYIGAGSGPATLSGKRSGNALNLAIRWAKDINGDRSAQLSLAKSGSRGLTLTTTDKDPVSGKAIVTSKILLHRK
ncbi:UNVERIFIED_ORG: hypothetical protein LHK14_16225 [Roseateles sp. XES5]|nr:hypothetical protein [Roseateles sp. XES5]